jgi:hypothetical protein
MATKVPLLDLTAQYGPIRDEVLASLTRVCDSQRFIMGPEVDGLERELAALLEVREAIGVSSGTDALLAAMMALGIGPGDEVITPTYRSRPPGASRASARRRSSSTSIRSPTTPIPARSTRQSGRGRRR